MKSVFTGTSRRRTVRSLLRSAATLGVASALLAGIMFVAASPASATSSPNTITITSTMPVDAVVSVGNYTPTATDLAGSTVTPSIGTSTSNCSISSSGSVTWSTAGSCVVDYNSGTANGYTAASTSETFTVYLGANTITITSVMPTDAVVSVGNYTPTATDLAGSTVTPSIGTSTSNCSISSSGSVTWSTAGSCVVDYNSGTTSSYFATSTSETFRVYASGGSNTITITSVKPTDAVVSVGRYTPTATDLAGSTVTPSVDSSSTSNCSISYGSVTWSTAGSCVVDYNSGAAGGYTAASTSETFTVYAANGPNTITITSVMPTDAMVNVGSYSPTATDLAGSTVTPSVVGTGWNSSTFNCSISAGSVTWSTAGSCKIEYNSGATGGYTATNTSETFTVYADNTITITSTKPVDAVVSVGRYTPTATDLASSTVTPSVDFSSTSNCSISGGGVIWNTSGSCVVDYNSGATGGYTATNTSETFTVYAANGPNTITISSVMPTDAVVSVGRYTPTATDVASSTVTPSIGTSTSNCSISGGSVTWSTAGSCVVDYNSGAAGGYTATSTSETFTVAAASSGGGSGGGSTTGPTNAPPPSSSTPGGLVSYGTPASQSVSSGASTSVSQTSTGATETLTVPVGALPSGTTVSVYPVTSTAALTAQVPAGQSYVVSFAVTWETPSGTSPSATTPITVAVSEPNIVAGDTIYMLTSTGLAAVGTATANGTVTITFSNDPTFLVTHKATSVAPSAPATVTATGGALSVVVTWTAPANTGGSAITGYVVTATAGNRTISCGTVTAAATTCTITGLKAGTAYAISVAAVNAIGTSVAATSTATTSVAATSTATTSPAAVTTTGVNSHTTGAHGFAVFGRTVVITITGGGFYGQPKLTSTAAGVKAVVIKDNGRILTVRVTTNSASARGWHTFTITLANGKMAKVNYLTK